MVDSRAGLFLLADAGRTVLRIYADGRLVKDVRLESSPATAVVSGLPSGPELAFFVQELNSGGLSPAVWVRVIRLPGVPGAKAGIFAGLDPAPE